jgi:hypothetical protein
MSFVKSTNVVTNTAITVDGLSGGTNGKVVRISGANTVTNAASSNSVSQLNTVLFKQGDLYYGEGVITGLSGLSSGASYFLGSDGSPTVSPPTPTSSVRSLYIGFALNTTDLYFRPSIPISGS